MTQTVVSVDCHLMDVVQTVVSLEMTVHWVSKLKI